MRIETLSLRLCEVREVRTASSYPAESKGTALVLGAPFKDGRPTSSGDTEFHEFLFAFKGGMLLPYAILLPLCISHTKWR